MPRVSGVRTARKLLVGLGIGLAFVSICSVFALVYREFTRRVLAARGYAVLSASSAIDALQLCDGYPATIDLLLTDVVMPSMTGPALADVLLDRYPGIKIIYMSGYATDAIDQRVFDPLVTFIAKPFGAQDLTSKIRAALDSRKP